MELKVIKLKFLPERRPRPVDGINFLINVNFLLHQRICLRDICGQTKLTADISSELQIEILGSLFVLETEARLVEGPGLGDVPGVV